MKGLPLIRPLVRNLHPYVPGEQPRIAGLIKLNTNENPYPPSPRVVKALKAAVDGRLRLYPNPTAQSLRERLARFHGCGSENIIVGNGSDELLAMAVRCFVEPADNRRAQRGESRSAARSLVQYFDPSYSLYPVLADAHGADMNPVPLLANFDVPSMAALKRGGRWNFRAALTFITTPNAPSGRAYEYEQLEALCRAQRGVVILDEAYVDFAAAHALHLARACSNVLVARTFSKAYSLCFQRVGYFVGHSHLIQALDKIRDSYNVNGLGQVAAMATLDDLPYYRANFKTIINTREQLSRDLDDLGFAVLPSETNFILARPPSFSAEKWQQKLREQKVLVRWFKYPGVRDYLRITIGKPEEVAALVKAAKRIVGSAFRKSAARQVA